MFYLINNGMIEKRCSFFIEGKLCCDKKVIILNGEQILLLLEASEKKVCGLIQN